MPWTPRALMDIKREFLDLALQEGANRRELCRRFGISPKTAYALLARYEQEGLAGRCLARASLLAVPPAVRLRSKRLWLNCATNIPAGEVARSPGA